VSDVEAGWDGTYVVEECSLCFVMMMMVPMRVVVEVEKVVMRVSCA